MDANLSRVARPLGKKQIWSWRLTTNYALRFLLDIEPFLQNKREQAIVAIQYQANLKRYRGYYVPDAEFKRRCTIAELLKTMKRSSWEDQQDILRRTRRFIEPSAVQLRLAL